MWTADLCRLRFIEAADTERRLPPVQKGPSSRITFWPAFEHDFADRVHWDGATHRDEQQARNNRRIPPSAGAIGRYHECLLDWTPKYIPEARRKLVWYWAFSVASGRSFSEVCRVKAWPRRTAYDRLDRLFMQLETVFRNDGMLLREIDESALAHIHAARALIDGTLARIVETVPQVQKPFWNAGGKLNNLPEVRDFNWAKKQAEREAKRRQKLGLGAA